MEAVILDLIIKLRRKTMNFFEAVILRLIIRLSVFLLIKAHVYDHLA